MKKNLLRTISLVSFFALYPFIAGSCGTGASLNPLSGSGVVITNVGDGNVSFDQNFLITFTVPVDTDTVTESSFFVVPTIDVSALANPLLAQLSDECDPDLAVEATVSCSSTTSCQLTPASPLEAGADYRLCLTSAIEFMEPEEHGVFLGYDVAFTTNDAVLESLALSPSEVSMDVEDTQQFAVTGIFDDDTTQTITDDLAWSSSDESVASVSQDGLVTAVALGEAQITVIQASTNLTAIAVASVDFPAGGAFRYTVGGTTSGLTGTLVLQVNGEDDLTQIADGDFTFDTTILDGEDYEVTVLTQPAGQTCEVFSGSGSVNGEAVVDVSVICATDDTTLSISVSTLGLSVNDTGLNAALMEFGWQ